MSHLGRLLSDNCGSVWAQTFSYDQYDNVTKSGSSAWNPGYNPSNNHYNNGSTYDNSGNLTSDTLHNYTWDQFNKLSSIDSTSCATNGECVTYDALGRIVETSYKGVYTEIWYTQLGKGVYMVNGSTPYYAYWPTPGGGTVEVNGNNVTAYYMHKDWLGNSRISSVIVNPAVVSDQAYAPYGEVYNKQTTGAGVPAQMFTGDTQDIVTGLFDTPNRELNAGQGRWLNPDPAAAGWNQYAYATDPLSSTDPSGLFSVSYSLGDLGGCGAMAVSCGNIGGVGEIGGLDEFDFLTLINTSYLIVPFFPDAVPGVLQPGFDWETGEVTPPPYQSGFGLDFEHEFLYYPNASADTLLDQVNQPQPDRAANNGQRGPDPLAVARSMRFAVETAIPTVCGGGVFGYGGMGGTAFGVKMFSGGIGEWDSNTGLTGGTLKEAGAGGVGVGFIHTSSGLSALAYAELGEIPFLGDAGAVAGDGWAGGYVEGGLFGGEVGGGAYANITSVAACDPF